MRRELQELFDLLTRRSFLENRWRVAQLYVAEMARALGTTERSVRRRLRRLQELGLIEIESTWMGHGGFGPNRYLLKGSTFGGQRSQSPALWVGQEIKLEGRFLTVAKEVLPHATLVELERLFGSFRHVHRMRRKPPVWWFSRWRRWLEGRRDVLSNRSGGVG